MGFIKKQVNHAKEDGSRNTILINLVEEEPLLIRIQGEPYSVMMRTPGSEVDHAVGLCFAEGVVDRPNDISTIEFFKEESENIVAITLSRSRYLSISETLKSKSCITNTSSGICGKEILLNITNKLEPIECNVIFEPKMLTEIVKNINKHQPLGRMTKATHCSVIYDENLVVLSSAEDVGRHNALDKVIGSIFLNKTLGKARLLTLSSRVSYELVQKAARACIPVVCAISRPTSLAVSLAKKLNITLATLSPSNGLLVHCNENRLC